MSIINLSAFKSSGDCRSSLNPIQKFGFSYSFELNKCYLIAGPRTPPSTIPTYSACVNGAPPGQFFRYNKTEDGKITLNMCSKAGCKVCNAPQAVEIGLCVTTSMGFNKYTAKTEIGDRANFVMAPLASVNWTEYPPLASGQSLYTPLSTTPAPTSTASPLATNTGQGRESRAADIGPTSTSMLAAMVAGMLALVFA